MAAPPERFILLNNRPNSLHSQWEDTCRNGANMHENARNDLQNSPKKRLIFHRNAPEREIKANKIRPYHQGAGKNAADFFSQFGAVWCCSLDRKML